jgi:Protein of unknown function (DUF3455)
MNNLVELTVASAMLFLATAFASSIPDVPENLKPPANAELILEAHATGVQIYVCQAESEQKSSWVLKAPDATLTDASGAKVITHFAGPSWKHVDGSLVTGKMIAKQDAPKPGAIPWLLVSVVSHSGDGVLDRVTTILRLHTEGGLPPRASDCTVATNGQESRSPYSADYYFYGPKKD